MNKSYAQNIKISILEKIDKFISEEAKEFKISKNKYLAEIFTSFDFEYVAAEQTRTKIYKEKTKSIQFGVPKNARGKYEQLEKEKIVIADYCREMLDKFLSLSKIKREQIIMHEKLEIIKKAIENGMRLNFSSIHRTDMVEPYKLEESLEYNKNYVICYKESIDAVVTYSLQNIIKITKRDDEQEYYYTYIDKTESNFDPFLSYNNIIKIRITPKGEKNFQIKKYLCPKVLKKNDDIWELECTPFKALLYFAEFYDEVEILEPKALRDNLIKKINKMHELYNEK